MIKKAAVTLGASLALAVTGAVLGMPAAHAVSNAATSGARATFAPSTEVFTLYDTGCDGNSVYLVYKVNRGPENRHAFGGGCGYHTSFDKSYAEGTRIEYKVCVEIRNATDRCSGWTTDHA